MFLEVGIYLNNTNMVETQVGLAQEVEHLSFNRKVASSIPSS